MAGLSAGEHDVVLNGVRIHCTVRGRGPTLIALYGGPGLDARGFADLARIDEFVTLIIMHPRGSGLSGPAPSDDDYMLAHYASDVEALCKYLRLRRPAVLGFSHGGMVAQQFAFTFPRSVSKLILAGASAHFGERRGGMAAAIEKFRGRPWFDASYAALEEDWTGDVVKNGALWAEAVKFYFRDFDARGEAYCQRIKGLPASSAPLECFNRREVPTMDLRPRLKDIGVPTLVIGGRHDPVTPLPMSEEIARLIAGARLEVFEGSGHFAFVEEPEKFYRVIEEFVIG